MNYNASCRSRRETQLGTLRSYLKNVGGQVVPSRQIKRIVSHQQWCAKRPRGTYDGPAWPAVLSRSISEVRPQDTGSSMGEASMEKRVSAFTGPILGSAFLYVWGIAVKQEVDSTGKKPGK